MMKTIQFADMNRQEIEAYALKKSLENEELNLELAYYKELVKSKQIRAFCAQSEKTDPNQLSLFNEAEAQADETLAEPKAERVCPTRKKKSKGKKDKLTRSLPKQTIVYDLTAEAAKCPVCAAPLHQMSRRIHKEIEWIPGKAIIKEHVQLVYSCRNCEKNGLSVPIQTAPMPTPLRRGSLLSPSLGAYVCVRKYENRDPLNKIASDLQRERIDLSKQTLCNWVLHLGNTTLKPLYERLHAHLLGMDLLHGDETTVQVLREEGRSAQQKSYMWVLRSGREQIPIVVYHYAPSRSASVLQELVKGFQGYLQSDGYAAYGTLGEAVIPVGCLAHVRRYYWDAKAAMPKEGSGMELAQKGIHFCNKLFGMERERFKLTLEAQGAYKEEKMRAVFEAFFAWAETSLELCPAKGLLRKALKYTLNQKKSLLNYLKDPRLELSNNAAERAIKPFVLGRKNWMFCDVPRGAQASAMIYSLMQTALENGLLPMAYFEYLFDQLRRIDVSDPDALDRLLPWSKSLPSNCYPRTDTTDLT